MIKDDNRGFSFVELLVVIAIIAVLMTISIGGMSYLNRTNAKKAISTIESTMNLVRNKSIAYKNPWKCQIEMNATGNCSICVYENTGTETAPVWEKFSEASLGSIQTVQVAVTGDTNPPTLTRNIPGTLEFYFKNSTGAFDKISRPGGVVEDPISSGNSFATMTVTTTANNVATIKLYFVSGKVDIV